MLLGLLLGALAVGIVICYVVGNITVANTKEQMAIQGMKQGMIEKIDRCTNQITVKDFLSGDRIKIEGDGISDELYRGQRIYV